MAESDQLFARFGRTCEPGEVLFREGEAGELMYVLQAGSVRITKAVKGEEKTLAILGPGEFFGEMAILNAKPRTATAVVEQRSKVLVLGARTFEQMVVSNAEIAVRLIQKLARRLDSANELIEVLMHRDPKARVILGLSREAQFLGERREDGSVRVPMSPEELAEQVGLSEPETREVLKRLERLSIVEVADEGLVVTDVDRLEEFYEFLEMREKFGDG
ncbi:MAG TPA: Crp/Fnr family transcriptional regulator [Sandaracinaceae bacterium LLY-WYZ-13_1]|nr:Crp/Fnr family transcriptional regulator [Sandaracinaceae bacterium LLY-WYZ-13_1]